jgi:hypothetical protein
MSTFAPPRIAVCQHPNGEGVWWDADRHGPGCIQSCDCTPAIYVRDDKERLVEAER